MAQYIISLLCNPSPLRLPYDIRWMPIVVSISASTLITDTVTLIYLQGILSEVDSNRFIVGKLLFACCAGFLYRVDYLGSSRGCVKRAEYFLKNMQAKNL